MLGRRLLTCFVALALLAPVLVSLGYETFRPWQWGPLGGDFAVLEVQLRAAARFEHWLGPYSRFGWSHPGPLYYYALAPLYWLSSSASTSLYASAAMITLGAAAAATALFSRERRAVGDRLAFALIFGAAAFDLWASKLPADPWNPVVTVLPFGAFCIACARLAVSRTALLPVCVLLHAFVSQTHISYCPCATVMLATAFGLCLWHRRSMSGAERGPLAGSLAISLLVASAVWLPTLIAELSSERSNIARILRHFAGEKATPSSFSFALTHGASRLQAPILAALRGGSASEDLGAVALQGVQLALLGVSIGVARARKDAFVVSLGTLAVVATIVCCWSCLHVGRGSPQLGYLTLWFAFVGMSGWLAIALALLPMASSAMTRGWMRVASLGLASALLAWGAVSDSTSVWARYRRMPGRSQQDNLDIAAATARVAALWRQAPAPLVLGMGEGRPWDCLAALVLGLEKHGLVPVLQERWRFMFGNGVQYVAPDAAGGSLLVSQRLSHAGRWLERFGSDAYLYLDAPAAPPPGRITVEASGADGDPAWVLDGQVPPEGAPPGPGGVLRLSRDAGSLTLRLPGLRVGELDAVAAASDAYVLEASEDGREFQRVAELASEGGSGLRRRHVRLPHAGPWRALRLLPQGGGADHTIAEVSLGVTSWGVTVLEAQGTRGSTRLAVDGSVPPLGSPWGQPGAVKLREAASFMTFGLPATLDQEVRVEGLQITADGNDEYEVSGSYDGTSFSPIGVIPPRRRGGLRTRRFYFNDWHAWSAVRLVPRGRDGRFSIAEVSPLVTGGRLIDFGREAAERYLVSGWSREPAAREVLVCSDAEPGRLRIPLQAGHGYQLELMLDAPRSVPVTLSLNAQLLQGVALIAGASIVRVDLPPRLVLAENELQLQLASVGLLPPGEPASVRLMGVVVTASSAPGGLSGHADQRTTD